VTATGGVAATGGTTDTGGVTGDPGGTGGAEGPVLMTAGSGDSGPGLIRRLFYRLFY
jgi:hypothetical protein